MCVIKNQSTIGIMKAQAILNLIYGVIFVALVYFIVRNLYSVYYTPGTTVLYDSPITQALFPEAKNKLFPTWGYNKAGMLKGDATKFGQNGFWPQSGKGFVPNKFGSGGPSPTGGMRPTLPIPDETEVGYWGNIHKADDVASYDIYDNSSQHVKYITPVGHWTD